MADDLDLAAEREEIARTAARSQRRPAGPPATGFCLWCEEPVAPEVRFCCPECRDQFDAASTRKRQLGARN